MRQWLRIAWLGGGEVGTAPGTRPATHPGAHLRPGLRFRLGTASGVTAGLTSPRVLIIAPPYVWLVVLLLVPFLLVVKISFSDLRFGVPPYTPLAELKDEALALTLHVRGYVQLLTDSLYLATYLSSIKMAAITALLCMLIGYPLAYQIARSAPATRSLLLLAVILPFWTSLLLRVYAWVGILRNDGLLNQLLMALGITSEPLEIYRTDVAVIIGMVYAYLPFFVLPLYATLVKLDTRLLEAAYDLGARPWQAFWRVTLPLSRPGVIAGAMLVFIPAVGEYVIPEMLGGANTLMMGRVIWNEFATNADWPMAASITVVMVLLLIAPMVWLQRTQTGNQRRSQTQAIAPTRLAA